MIIRIPIKQNNNKMDKECIRFICMIYFCLSLNNLFNNVFRYNSGISNVTNTVIKALLIFVLISAIYNLVKGGKISLLIVCECIVAIIYMFGFLLGYSNISTLTNYAFWTMGVCVPAGVCIYVITDKQDLLDALYKLSWVLIVILVPISVINIRNTSLSSYNMSFGYMLLFPAIILLQHFSDKLKAYDIVVSLICAVLVLFYGNRGAILYYGIFAVILIIFNIKRRFIQLFSVLVFVLAAVNFERLLELLNIFAINLGFESRNIRLLLAGQSTYASGRTELWSYYLNKIQQKPFFGWGVTGGWIAGGSYPHNFIVELILAFGIPLGILLVIAIIANYVNILTMRHSVYKSFGLIFMAHSFSIFTSSTILDVPSLYLTIGISAYYFRNVRKAGLSSKTQFTVSNQSMND